MHTSIASRAKLLVPLVFSLALAAVGVGCGGPDEPPAASAYQAALGCPVGETACDCGCASACYPNNKQGAASCASFCKLACATEKPPGGPPPDPVCPAPSEQFPFPTPLTPPEEVGLVAGATEGKFAVTNDGDASYTIPIAVPPGRVGMQPNVAITFNSSRGVGLVGKGFSLSGLSTIERCGSNFAQDGFVQGVRYDSTDHFCLDGARLVPVGTPSGGTTEYRTFPDSFRKIVAQNSTATPDAGPIGFTVYEANGTIARYAITTSVAKGKRFGSWLLSQRRDRHANTVVYEYDMDKDANGDTLEYWPTAINYTGSPTLPADKSVLFVYRPLTKPAGTPVPPLGATQGTTPLLRQEGFRGGHGTVRSKLLTKIRTTVKTTAGSAVLREYSFEYHPSKSTTWPLLDSVTECALGRCKRPTTFAWNDDGYAGLGKTKVNPSLTMPQNDCGPMMTQIATADVNGDGLPDVIVSTAADCEDGQDTNVWHVALNLGGGAFAGFQPWASFKYPDFDYVIHQPMFFLSLWGALTDFLSIVFLPLNMIPGVDVGFADAACLGPFCMSKNTQAGKGPLYEIRPLDVDQDGLMDLVLFRPNGLFPGENCSDNGCNASTIHYLRSVVTDDGNGNVSPGKFELTSLNVPQFWMNDTMASWQAENRLPFDFFNLIKFGDVNGDGVADLIECADPNGGITPSANQKPPYPVCINPVGCEDSVGAVCHESSANGPPCAAANKHWRVYLWSATGGTNGGPGYSANNFIEPPWQYPCGYARGLLHIVDTDGDGKVEVLGPALAGVTQTEFPHLSFDPQTGKPVLLPGNSPGLGSVASFTFNNQTGQWTQRDTHLPMQVGASLPPVLMDVNGDGYTDFVYPWGMEKNYANQSLLLGKLMTATSYPDPRTPLWGTDAYWMPSTWTGAYPPDVPFVNLNLGDGTFADATPITSNEIVNITTLPNSNGGTTGPYTQWNISGFASAMQSDLNGDGLMDLIYPIVGAEAKSSWLGDALLPIDGTGQVLEGPSNKWIADPTTTAYWAVYMGLPGGTYGGTSSSSPRFAKNQHQFSDLVTTNLPFGAGLPPPTLADFDGDGRDDLLAYTKFFPTERKATLQIYMNEAPKDRLVEISDGMNVTDRGDATFLPSVSISYSTLTDSYRTAGTHGKELGDAFEDFFTYRAHYDPQNDCRYPLRCVVSNRPVVGSYALADGQGGARRFDMQYRDGRAHLLGRGWLGFGEVRTVDYYVSGGGEIKRFDNYTPGELNTYPFAGMLKESITWSVNGIKGPDPGRVAVSYRYNHPRQIVHWPNQDYFNVNTRQHSLKFEGVSPSQHVLPRHGILKFVIENDPLESGNVPAAVKVLSDTTTETSGFDVYGNAAHTTTTTAGIDQVDTTESSYDNDATTWLIRRPKLVRSCSTASGGTGSPITQCVERTTHYTSAGDPEYVSVADGNGDPQLASTTHTTYDTFGNVIGTTADDAFGHHRASCVSYDAATATFPYASANGLSHVTRYRFNPQGTLSATVDPNLLMTRFAYDAFDRTLLTIAPDGTSVTTQRARVKAPLIDRNGAPTPPFWSTLVVSAESDGDERREQLDGAGRTVMSSTTGPIVEACSQASGNCTNTPAYASDTFYDSLGRAVKTSLPYLVGDSFATRQFVTTTYDGAGRVIEETSPWSTVTRTYDGLTTTTSDGIATTTTIVDRAGRPSLLFEPNGGSTTWFVYGPFGAQWSVDHGGQITTTEHDALGRVRREKDANRGETTIDYDGFGEAMRLVDANGRLYVNDYDAIGRLRNRLDEEGVTAWYYDIAPMGSATKKKLGALAATTNYATTSQVTYDALGRPQQTTESVHPGPQTDSFTTQYTYANNRLSSIAFPSPAGVTPFAIKYGYDARGHVIVINDANGKQQPLWNLRALNGWGAPSKESWGGYTANQRSLTYDPTTRQLSGIQSVSSGFNQSLGYSYDAHRNVRTRTGGDKLAEHFCYDALDRLVCSFVDGNLADVACDGAGSSSCQLKLAYGKNGNIEYKSDVGSYNYSAAHPNAVESIGPPGTAPSYFYDAVGNQTVRPDGKVGYTSFDLPAVYVGSHGDKTNLWYDANHRRVRKSDGVTETTYVGKLYERQRDLATQTDTHRYFVPLGTMRLEVTRQAGVLDQLAFVLPDALGSPDQTVNSAGSIKTKRSFDAFGQERDATNWKSPVQSSPTQTRAFTGQESEGALPVVNMNGRIYDPRLGRFLQTDPIISDPFSAQRWNAYSYVLNNPLRYTDPSGFDEELAPTTIVGSKMTYDEAVTAGQAGATIEMEFANGVGLSCEGGQCTKSDPMGPVTQNDGSDAMGVPEPTMNNAPLDPGAVRNSSPSMGGCQSWMWSGGGAVCMDGVGGRPDFGKQLHDEWCEGRGTALGAQCDQMLQVPVTTDALVEAVMLDGMFSTAGKAASTVKQWLRIGRGDAAIHFTSKEAFASIEAQSTLQGKNGIFALPASEVGRSTLSHALLTGIRQNWTTHIVWLPEAAAQHFHRVLPIGPYSALKSFARVRFSAPGAINTATGAFTQTGSILHPYAAIYGPDVLLYGMLAGLYELLID